MQLSTTRHSEVINRTREYAAEVNGGWWTEVGWQRLEYRGCSWGVLRGWGRRNGTGNQQLPLPSAPRGFLWVFFCFLSYLSMWCKGQAFSELHGGEKKFGKFLILLETFGWNEVQTTLEAQSPKKGEIRQWEPYMEKSLSLCGFAPDSFLSSLFVMRNCMPRYEQLPARENRILHMSKW